MIPKIIHYRWFGNQPIPKHLQACMSTWSKVLPDYQIIRWDEKNFDVNSTVWTKEAYNLKKYAFVSDYVRLIALKKMGGIYLDTDVVVKKRFDSLLAKHAFMGFENELYLTSAIMGLEPDFPILDEFIEWYTGKHFALKNGALNNAANVIILTEICKKHGLIIKNSIQEVDNISIFTQDFFCPLDFYHNNCESNKTLTVHLFDGSWLDDNIKTSIRIERNILFKLYIKAKNIIKKIMGAK